MHTRPVWVEISRAKLIANYRELRRMAAGAEVLAVVKANAYGHGMRDCARALAGAGAHWLGVTSVEEGIAARAVCGDADILVMSGICEGEAGAAIEHRLTPIVWEGYQLDLLEAAALRLASPPQSVPVHLEIDTGMSRQGVRLDDPSFAAILQRFHAGSALRMEGLATHFSAPEAIDDRETMQELARLKAAVERIAVAGHRPGWLHAGNSANVLRGAPLEALAQAARRLGGRLMLRPGLALYGYAPRLTYNGQRHSLPGEPSAELSPVLSWKTRVTSLRTIQPGDSVGYNSTFRAQRATRLALLPIGYADGLSRGLSNRGSVLVRGRRAPVAGRVSMDQTVVDGNGIAGIAIGDEAVLIGSQGDDSISAYEIADLMGTVPYEVLCGIASRVPRVLIE